MTKHVSVVPRLTAIGSGKGGTGKTLLAANLAGALAREGERVLLFDADLGLSNAAVHLGLAASGNMPSLLCGACRLEDAVVPVAGGINACGGFDLIAAPSGSGALADVGAIAAEGLIAKLRVSRLYTRVLIDLGAGVDATVMRFASASDETILILTPDPTALTDAYAFAKLLLRATGTRMPLAVVNMTASDGDARRTYDAMAATCGAFLKSIPEFLGAIPRDRLALEAVRRQLPLSTYSPQSPATRAIGRIAQELHVRHGRAAQPARAAGKR